MPAFLERRTHASGEVSFSSGWFGVAAGPLAWLAAFLINLFILQLGCSTGVIVARYAILLAALLVSAAALLVAWRNWQVSRDASLETGGDAGVARLASLYGIVLSTLSVALLIALAVTTFALDACIHGSLSYGHGQ